MILATERLSYRFCRAGDEIPIGLARRGEIRYDALIGDIADQFVDDDALDPWSASPGRRVLIAESADHVVGVVGIVIAEDGSASIETWTVPGRCVPTEASQFALDAAAYLGQCGFEQASVTAHIREFNAVPPSGGAEERHPARTERYVVGCDAQATERYAVG